MEEKCNYKYDGIKMETSKDDNNKHHIDVNFFNNNEGNKLYKINDERELVLDRTHYAITESKSQCNNITEQWQKWFATSYYYLGNRDGRYNEMAKNVITYDIPNGCYNACQDDYIINRSYKCENKKTFEYGKYKSFLPYDPLAIICIIGSHFKPDFIHKKNEGYKGNYYYTLNKLLDTNEDNLLKKNKFVNISPKIRENLLAKIDSDVNCNPVKTIRDDITKAYERLKDYIKFIHRENEQNSERIIKVIKKDVEKFYNLFDKRDEFYIKYLNDFNNLEKKKYNISYAHSLASEENYTEIRRNINERGDRDIQAYIQFLFNYCRFVCFSKFSIFAERLKLYGIYDTLDVELEEFSYNTDEILSQETPDQEQSGGEKPIYKIMPIKLENEPINIFDEYTYIFKLYKSFLIVYPTVFTIILSALFLLLIFYILNIFIGYKISIIINLVYAFILWCILVFTYCFVLNGVFIWIMRQIKWILIDGDYITRAFKRLLEQDWIKDIIKIAGYPLAFLIFLIVLIYIIVTHTFEEFLMIIPNILIYILQLIYYFAVYMIKLLIYILLTFKPENIITICFFIYLLFVYYYIFYSFKYGDIENLLGKIDLNSDIKTLGHPYVDGDKLIIGTYENIEACKIIWNRVELLKYKYLLNLYGDAYDILKEMPTIK
jgi:hypothetical protein